MLQPANDQFLCYDQQEIRGSGKNRRVYNRTIMNVTVPDTRTHMIINSRINDETFGLNNLTNYKSSQKYEPEGDFAKYFDVYMPGGLETEGLAILAPNTLTFIMDNLANFDIEIVSNQLYVYAYSFLDVAQIDQLIINIGHLAGLMRLQASNAMPALAGAAPVARVASGTAQPVRLVKGWHAVTGGLFGLFVLGRFVGLGNNRYGAMLGFVAGLGIVVVYGYSAIRKRALKKSYTNMKKQEIDANKPN